MRKTKKILNNLIENYLIENKIEDSFEKTIIKFAAPSLILYTKWILEDAKKREYDKLYFLMRDGKILMDIANIISPTLDCNIEKSLIYCSRNSLRQACYHINNEHLSLLFHFLPNRTLSDVLLRLFNEQELEAFKQISKISEKDFTKQLSKTELEDLKNKILNNQKCMDAINQKSQNVFDCCLGYLDNCGVFEKDKKFALVDTGWTGSMLRSLQEIVNAKGNIVLNEYFYGLFSLPTQLNLNNCHTFAFSPINRQKNKVYFENNLLECFCGDPSGTTLSFGKIDGKFAPILETPNSVNQETYTKQQKLILDFAKYLINSIDITTLNNNYAVELLKKISCNPTKEEVEALNIYKFNEDTTEYSLSTLSTQATFKQLFSFGFLGRVFIKLKLMKEQTFSCYWFFGSLKISKVGLKCLLRLNRFLIRYINTRNQKRINR